MGPVAIADALGGIAAAGKVQSLARSIRQAERHRGNRSMDISSRGLALRLSTRSISNAVDAVQDDDALASEGQARAIVKTREQRRQDDQGGDENQTDGNHQQQAQARAPGMA